MRLYPTSNNENERVKELYSYHILDSGFEKEFDDLVNLAAKMLRAPVAAISFIDDSRQWIKARTGLTFCEASRDISVCNYTILQEDIFEVENMKMDGRFSSFPYVINKPCYRHYAGVPLITKNGFKIGVFYVIDIKARRLNNEERDTLILFAQQAMKQVELRLENIQLEKQNQQQRYISSMLSHDIRGPLSNIKTVLSLQHDGNNILSKAETASMNEALSKQVNGAINMLTNITNWGKLQIEGRKKELQSINLRQLADEVIGEIDNATKSNMLVNAVPSSVNVLAEEEGVRFALRNLLTNANKFTSNGCIVISHENKEGKNYIHVTDSGTGMSKEQADNLNKNKPVGSSYGTHNEKGNGLGLGLVHDYLINKGGFLNFQSEIGKGTRVSFSV